MNFFHDALMQEAEAIYEAYKPAWWQWRRRKRWKKLTPAQLAKVMMDVLVDERQPIQRLGIRP